MEDQKYHLKQLVLVVQQQDLQLIQKKQDLYLMIGIQQINIQLNLILLIQQLLQQQQYMLNLMR